MNKLRDWLDSVIPNQPGCALFGVLLVVAVLLVWLLSSDGPSNCGGKGQPACPVIVPIIVPHVNPPEDPHAPVEPPHVVPVR